MVELAIKPGGLLIPGRSRPGVWTPARAYGPLTDPSGKELTDTIRPWNGELPVEPWRQVGASVPIRAIDQEVLRPGLYDRYTFKNNLCAAWATLLPGKRLSTHDVVRLTVELDAVSRDTVEIVLRTGPDVFWWKAIRLPDWTMIETEAANTEVSALHSAAGLVGGQLIFHKAQGALLSRTRPVWSCRRWAAASTWQPSIQRASKLIAAGASCWHWV